MVSLRLQFTLSDQECGPMTFRGRERRRWLGAELRKHSAFAGCRKYRDTMQQDSHLQSSQCEWCDVMCVDALDGLQIKHKGTKISIIGHNNKSELFTRVYVWGCAVDTFISNTKAVERKREVTSLCAHWCTRRLCHFECVLVFTDTNSHPFLLHCHEQLPWTTTSLVAAVFIFKRLRPKVSHIITLLYS